MTVDEAIERWDDASGESDDEYDDSDEPIMEGSDDEFSDLEDAGGDDGENDLLDVASPPDDPTTPPDDDGLLDSSMDPGSDMDTDSEPEWTTTLKRNRINSSSPVGPAVSISKSPSEVFQLFFTPELLDMIVKETNSYAKHVLGDEKFSKWRKMDVVELKALLGFKILMAINNLPSIDDYWKRDPLLRYSPVADRISRDRFRELSRYLHFVDNNTLVPRGTRKVRPLIDHLASRFTEMYEPHCEVSVDEAMIKFQGRSSLKQYMPLKPTKRGIKVWVLADSHNGYFKKFEVYSGKKGNSTEKGLGAKVVKSLTSELHRKNHHVFFDNYFTSVNLLEDLLADGIYACGTARKDRKGFPEMLKKAKLPDRYARACKCTRGVGEDKWDSYLGYACA